MTRVHVRTETDTATGWVYEVGLESPGDGLAEHRITLSWVDHDHLSGGVCPPSKVVETLLEVLLDDPPVGGIPPRFDASSIRRLVPDLDDSVRARL